MYSSPKYTFYKNRRIPGWWADYLPEEENPYRDGDTLTLEPGCLSDYWHIHSSNKHPNFKGAEACNAVQKMVYERFGGAFLSGSSGIFGHGGHRGQASYHEPEHLAYGNAFLEGGKIHIKNARQYYEDVASFVLSVLQMISTNRMQSGSDYNASCFFPYYTDAQLEQSRLERIRREEKTAELRETLTSLIGGGAFAIDSLAYSAVTFNPAHSVDDGWFNDSFVFHDLKTNLDKTVGTVKLLIDTPHFFKANHEKKEPERATKTLKIPYCLYLYSNTAETNRIVLPIPPDKVADSVKQAVADGCDRAMAEYNAGHIDAVEHTYCTPAYRSYPANFFLDNGIGRLELVYTFRAGAFSWRMQFL